jgi:hypothetical protein
MRDWSEVEIRCLVKRMIDRGLAQMPKPLTEQQVANLLRAVKEEPDHVVETNEMVGVKP